ncbi:MAG: GUN4 domain-containing protein [Gomphosphaeria aponina SAG 52.96 = DSM 107014]|uniref:non-specific serine/threonine protein kinase n=1 Tax=Gomphosphaeria aponina SAG 52.96 = DSM 107014 TaxID=1521640 RepID=A0A941GWA4_9CHRO|nr:GUN4 domain-containing protein [Gomphosphaeria aponina SAG 52.96 = DSM 107014]
MNNIKCLNPNCLADNPAKNKFCQKCGTKLLLRERYRAISLIGQGGFSKTFLAIDEDKPSNPYCVIKQFFPQTQDEETRSKASKLFKQEADRLEALGSHPQIPALFAYFSQEGRKYLIQEYINGQNLAQELAEIGPFNEQKIRQLLIDLLSVLEFIHNEQVLHRDIKPENIIRRQDDNQLVLVDFGAAKYVTQTSLKVTGTLIGSTEYVAPEQIRGKPTFASDLYSLGVTCIHLLTEINPLYLYDINEEKWVWRQYLFNNPISDELGNVLDKLIQNAPRKRFQSASEVIQKIMYPNLETQINWIPPAVKIPGKIQNIPYEYQILHELLILGDWQAAERETYSIMVQVANREQEGWLSTQEIAHFPCIHLKMLDQLWVKYSNGRFGFTVQKEIYVAMGGDRNYNPELWEAFCQRVGWLKGEDWVFDKDIIYDITAPPGHLPAFVRLRASSLLIKGPVSRLMICEL